MQKILPFLFLASVFATSCKDKLELNAPYKEVPIVYAILNPSERTQVIRINKVFLGDGDANMMAQISDSVNYGPGELTVTLRHEYSPGKVITFNEKMITTGEGPFSREQRVYYTDDAIYTSGTYSLTIKNNHTGNIFTARTTAIGAIPLSGIAPFVPPFFPVDRKLYNPNMPDPNVFLTYEELGRTYSVRYRTTDNAKIYNLTMRFHFYDSIETLPPVNYRNVDFTFGNQYSKDVTSFGGISGLLVTSFKGSDLMAGLGLALSRMNLSTTVYGRKIYKIEFIVYASTQEYLDFIEYSKPSLSINTQKPLYSNFDRHEAIGIFTFRSVMSVEKELSAASLNLIASNASTCKYKFMRFDLFVPGCR